MRRRLRHKLVQLAYLGKGLLEAGLGELRRHDGVRVTTYGTTGHGKTFGSDESYREFYRDEVANGNTPH